MTYFSGTDRGFDNAGLRAWAQCSRGEQRRSMFVLAALRREGAPDAMLRVRNLSTGGLMADCHVALGVGETMDLELRGIGRVAARVIWARRGRVGLAFVTPIDPRLLRQSAQRVAAATTPLRPVVSRTSHRPALATA